MYKDIIRQRINDSFPHIADKSVLDGYIDTLLATLIAARKQRRRNFFTVVIFMVLFLLLVETPPSEINFSFIRTNNFGLFIRIIPIVIMYSHSQWIGNIPKYKFIMEVYESMFSFRNEEMYKNKLHYPIIKNSTPYIATFFNNKYTNPLIAFFNLSRDFLDIVYIVFPLIFVIYADIKIINSYGYDDVVKITLFITLFMSATIVFNFITYMAVFKASVFESSPIKLLKQIMFRQ